MNYVEVTGGPAKEREIVEKTVLFCIKKLMPRVRTLDIEVMLTKCEAMGYCLCTDDNKTFELEIRKGQKLYDLISTVCHEMVHVKQYYRKELTPNYTWLKKDMSDVEYSERPWEIEAYELEQELALECFKELEINFKKSEKKG